MRFRKLASTTAGALVFGALTVPLMATPAQAAPATAGTASFTTICSSTAAGRTSTTTLAGSLAVTVDGKSVSAVMNATANFDAAALQVSKLASKFVLDIDGAAVTVNGEKTLAPPVAGNTGIALPTMTGTREATAAPVKFDVTSAEVSMTMQFASATYTCALPDIAAVSFPAPAKDLSFTCSAFGASYDYKSDLKLAAQAKLGGKVAVTASMDAMPNPAPAFVSLPGQQFAGTLVTDLGNLAGVHGGDFKGGTPIAIPALTGSMNGSGSTLTMAVKEFTLVVPTYDNMTIPCKLAAPKTFTVDVAPLSKVCTDANAGLPGAQAAHTAAINTANAEAGKVAPANAAVAAATKAVKKADSSVKKANSAVKKANKAVKKAKGKAKKAKAKKNVTKKKKAVTKAKKAQKKAKTQLAAANAQLAAAQNSSAAANTNAASAAAAVTALQNTIKNC